MAILDRWQFREHRPWNLGDQSYVQISFNVGVWFSGHGRCIRISSGSLAYGRGYFFRVFNKTFLQNKKLRIQYNWSALSFGGSYHRMKIMLLDGDYDRSNDSLFPDLGELQYKGNGVIQLLRERGSTGGYFYWYDETFDLDVSNATQQYVTLMIMGEDGQCYEQANDFKITIEDIQLLDQNNNVVFRWDFDYGQIVYERQNTTKDYAYFNYPNDLPYNVARTVEEAVGIGEQKTHDVLQVPSLVLRPDKVLIGIDEYNNYEWTGIRSVSYIETSPWVHIDIPSGTMLHQHIKSVEYNIKITCKDFNSLYNAVFETAIDDEGHTAIDTSQYYSKNVIGYFTIVVVGNDKKKYKIKFEDVKVKSIYPSNVELGLETEWVVELTAKKIKYGVM
jgi:hypothetical protein